MLSFIYGAAGCGKTREIYRRAAEDAAHGRRAYILVPEQYSMYTERELLSRMGLSAQNRIQVLTFSRLCNMVFAKCGPLRMKYIDKAGKYMTAQKALRVCEPNLTYLRPNVHQRGFAAAAAAAFSEFKRYGVTPEALTAAADAAESARLGMKLRDLGTIFRSYNEITCENHSDSEDNLSLIIPKISACDFISGTFYINFFRSFTPGELQAISEIMKRADVCVALCCDSPENGAAPFASQKKTRAALCAAAAELGIAVSAPVRIDNSDSARFTDELRHIRDSYFAPRPEPMLKKPESVHIVRPVNRYAEVTACASQIMRLLRRGLTFNDFLILTGSMESYERLIPQIFTDFGISFFLDKKLPMTESPFMRMVITALEILAYGFSCERVMTLARCGFFDASDDLCDIFENYVLAADVGHRMWNMREDWEYNPDERMFDMAAVNEARRQLVVPVLDLADMFRGRKTVAQVCGALIKWLSSIGMTETVGRKIDSFNAASRPELAEQLRLVWNALISVTGQLTEYMGDDLVTFSEFHELFVSACGELTVGMIPPSRDAVIVSEPDRFRSVGTKIVIILGACDKAFPREHNAEGIISDAERAYLAENGLTLAPDAFGRQLDEQFVIYSALTAAREQLWIFSPMSDRDGKSLGASEVTERLRGKLFPMLEFEDGCAAAASPESREYIFRELSVRLLSCRGDEERLSPEWRAALGWFRRSGSYDARLGRLAAMCRTDAAPAPISAKCAERLYGAPLVLSVSRLEKYNACAFSFFMRYGLLARERMLGGFQARDMGTALHDVLCEYFRGKSENDADYGSITRGECESEISALVDRIAYDGGETQFAQSCYSKYIALRMKSIAAATAWKLVRFYSASRFRPCGFEISFGRRGVLPPYRISGERGGVYLEGFIDRADEMRTDGHRYICITDYKSSEKRLDRALAEAGISFQPLIYANALCASETNAEPAAMIYLHMNDPLIKSDRVPTEEELEREMNDGIRAHGIILDEPEVLSGIDEKYDDKTAVHYMACDSKSVICREEMRGRLDAAERKAAETAEKIADGQICPNPVKLSGFDSCAYCPYGGVCGLER